MSVSAADRARIDEQQTKTREEYENRETETVRRKNNEIKNAELRHNEEIKKLTETFQNQVDNLQRRSSESLTTQDLNHRKSVDELKTLYTEQLRKKNQQSSLERKSLTDTFKSEISKEKEISEGQRQYMLKKKTGELTQRDEQFNSLTERSREKMKEAIDNNSTKLRDFHEKEKDFLVKNKVDTVIDKNREMDEVRKAYKGEIGDLKRKKENLDKNWQQKYFDTVKNHNEIDGDNLINRSDELRAEKEAIQQHYQKALAEKTANMDITNDNFKSDVNDRMNAQVRSRDSQIQLLKEKNVHDKVAGNKLNQLEKNHLIRAYEDRMANIDVERGDYIEHMNNLVHRRVNDSREKNEHLAREANNNYRSQMNLINTRNREERKIMELQQKNQLDHVSSSAEGRVSRLQRASEDNTNALDRHYEESVDILKEGYAGRIAEQRDKVIEERAKQSAELNKRVHNMGNNYQTKLDNLQSEYKETLGKMRDDHRRELRRIETNYKNFAVDREKGHKVEKESIEQKYESKIAAIVEQNQQEKELTQKRHEEDMKTLAQRLSNYSRKA